MSWKSKMRLAQSCHQTPNSDWKSSQHFLFYFIFFQVKQNFLPFQLFSFLFFNFLNVKAGLFQTLTLFGYMKFCIVVFILSSQIQRHCSTDWILSAGRNLTEEQLDVRVGPSAGVLSFSYFIISLVHFLHAAACHSSKPLDTINRNETKILNTAKFKKKNLYKVIIRWSTFI